MQPNGSNTSARHFTHFKAKTYFSKKCYSSIYQLRCKIQFQKNTPVKLPTSGYENKIHCFNLNLYIIFLLFKFWKALWIWMQFVFCSMSFLDSYCTLTSRIKTYIKATLPLNLSKKRPLSIIILVANRLLSQT